jgi:hypothetical protein
VKVGTGGGHCVAGAGDFQKNGVDTLLYKLAGPVGSAVADRVFPVYRHAVHTYIRLARAGKAGSCDGCSAAKHLVAFLSEWPDEELVKHYLYVWRKATDLFDRVDVRIQAFRLADALQQRRLLTGAEIAELIDVEVLREARQAIESK